MRQCRKIGREREEERDRERERCRARMREREMITVEDSTKELMARKDEGKQEGRKCGEIPKVSANIIF